MEKREFFYIAPSISIVDMHFESAVLGGSIINDNIGDEYSIELDD